MGVGAVTVAESLEGGDGLGVEKRWGRGVAQFIECSFQQTTVALVIRLVSVGLGQFEVEERQETEKVALYVLLRGEVPHTHASLAGWSHGLTTTKSNHYLVIITGWARMDCHRQLVCPRGAVNSTGISPLMRPFKYISP